MNSPTSKEIEAALSTIESAAKDIRTILKETKPEKEPSAAEMVKALVASTGGKRYVWADRFGVDEIQLRRWMSGETQPDAEHLKLIKEAYKELFKKKR